MGQDTTSLLRSVGTALQSLGKEQARGLDAATGHATGSPDATEGLQTFQDSMDQFIKTLRSIDVRMKRQIMGLDEAGIISLPDQDGDGDQKSKTLKPDGHGKVAGFDVGWLNSRTEQVERAMEAQIWDQVPDYMATMVQNGSSQGFGEEDTHMSS